MRSGFPIALLGLFLTLVPSDEASAQAAVTTRTESPAAPLTADTSLNAADLRMDLEVLRRAFETLHPGLLRYNTPARIDAAFDELDREFRQDRTLAQAYLAFSKFAAGLKCGHTYPNFFNQKKSVAAALFQALRIPFYFRWLGDRMVVTRSFTSDKRIRSGTEILSINGIPVAAILEQLMTVARADGNNDAKRVAWLQVEGASRYEAFDIYWPLFFPSKAAEIALTAREPGNSETVSLKVPPMSDSERIAAMEASARPNVDKAAAMWDFRMLDERTGYLKMPSWAMYNSKWNWREFLDRTFESLVNDRAMDLIVDLRGNEGGNDVGDVIVSHLITASVPRQKVIRRVRYRKVPEDLVPYLDTWDPGFLDWGTAAIEPSDRFFRLRRDASDDPGGVIEPAAPRFGGRLWVLVGATNSSATFEFAQTVRQNELGTLVGQPTGGNQRGINGGAFFFLRLPRTGIELDLPLIGQFRDGEWPDAGLHPDIPVAQTVKDIAEGRDAELDAARERIGKMQSQGGKREP